MPCYYPVDGWRAKAPNQNGKYPIVFNRREGQQDCPVKLPCGRCIGCRLEQSRQWALRCTHEASMHAENSFITLTYNDEHLPADQGLNLEHWQTFMKRLRRSIEPKRIKYFACGEYGQNRDPLSLSTLGRPHFHAIVFGHAWSDKTQISENHQGDPLYTSQDLEDTWGKGMVSIGEVNFASAGYVARYCTKKITGEKAQDHYSRTNPVTGEITYVRPEMVMMSRGRKKGEGIGASWWRKYKADTHKDFITHDGHKNAIPRYYDKLMADSDEDRLVQVKRQRENNVDSLDADMTLDRLRVKEQIKEHTIENLARTL